jgi:hypothetical protein
VRPSYIGTLIAGVIAAVVGAVLAIYVLFNHSCKYAWFYWIAPLLLIGFLLVMGNMCIQYWFRVGRLEAKGRPRK